MRRPGHGAAPHPAPAPARRARARRAAAALLALACAGGCGGDGAAGGSPPAATGRTVREAGWTTRWQAGGPGQDTVLLFPVGLLTADEEQVYVPDAGGHRVAALRVSDGSLAWTFGRKGSGPGEFLAFLAIELSPSGEIVVADPQNARLTVLGRDGTYRRAIQIRNVSHIESFCPLPDGGFLVSTGSSEPEPLLLISAAGEVKARYPVPWPSLRGEPGIRRQMYAAAAGGNGCVLALKMGMGFGVRTPEGTTRVAPYVESLELPPVRVTEGTGPSGGRVRSEKIGFRQTGPLAAGVQGDTLVLPFGGRTADASRLVDLYHLPDGRYLFSYRLPRRVIALSRRGRLHYLLTQQEGYPVLIAAEMTLE